MSLTLRYLRTALFKRSFGKLDHAKQELIRVALKSLPAHPHHPYPPELKVHRLKGMKGASLTKPGKKVAIWEFHADGDLIITFQTEANDILLRNCGNHGDVLRNP